jgi:hypothetical protein
VLAHAGPEEGGLIWCSRRSRRQHAFTRSHHSFQRAILAYRYTRTFIYHIDSDHSYNTGRRSTQSLVVDRLLQRRRRRRDQLLSVSHVDHGPAPGQL